MRIVTLPNSAQPHAIVIGGHINGLGVARSLAARGVRVTVVKTQPFDMAHHSRDVAAHYTVPALDEHPEALIEVLERHALRWTGAMIYPTNDGALAALSSARNRLEQTYALLMPSTDAVDVLLDKSRMHAMAIAAGLPTPTSYGLAARTELPWEQIRFPVVVKPLVGHQFARRFGAKLFVAHDRAALEQCCDRVQAVGIACQVQALIEGADDQIFAYCLHMDRHGAPSRGLVVHKIRQSPPFFGVARVAEVVGDDTEMRECAIALLRQIGFRGVAAVEFKRDARDGTLRFIEVNGRTVIYNALLRRAGLDLAAMVWEEHATGRAPVVETKRWPGRWINLHADLLYSALDRTRDPVSWSRFAAPYRGPLLEATWSTRDPMPFLAQWARSGIDGISAVTRGRYRDRMADRTRIETVAR